MRERAAARAAALLALTLAAAAPRAAAQEFLDRGTFVIERGGTVVGREEYAIRRTTGLGGGSGVLAVATVHYRDRELRPALELSGGLEPLTYQLDVSQGGRVVERYSVQFAPGRIAARVATQRHELLREFPAPPGVVVLDDDAFHEFYFVPRAAAGGTRAVRLLLPRRPALADGVVERVGPDTVTVGDRTLAAERFALNIGADDQRLFWFTPDGDLLRVAVPARDLVATRAELPIH